MRTQSRYPAQEATVSIHAVPSRLPGDADQSVQRNVHGQDKPGVRAIWRKCRKVRPRAASRSVLGPMSQLVGGNRVRSEKWRSDGPEEPLPSVHHLLGPRRPRHLRLGGLSVIGGGVLSLIQVLGRAEFRAAGTLTKPSRSGFEKGQGLQLACGWKEEPGTRRREPRTGIRAPHWLCARIPSTRFGRDHGLLGLMPLAFIRGVRKWPSTP